MFVEYTHTLLGSSRTTSDPQTGDFTSLPPHASESLAGRNIPQFNGV
jgi:ribonuclease Z